MVITRRTNCPVCGKRLEIKKDFVETVDMFQPNVQGIIPADISAEVKAFRDKVMYCEEHMA